MTRQQILDIASRNHEANNLLACKQIFGKDGRMGLLRADGLVGVSSFSQLVEMGEADPEVAEIDQYLNCVLV